MVEMSPLMNASEETGEMALNHAGFNELQDALCLPPGGPPPPPALPANERYGEMFGMLMHQGKYVGAWKKAYFVLKGSTLFQYEANKEGLPKNPKKPKKSFFVSYCMPEKMAAEALAEEASAKYLVKLEEKACSLRINVYTPDKLKVLTAPSEETMNEWVKKLEESVATSCNAASEHALKKKQDAAELMKPLMMAQTFAEVDTYHTLVNNLISAGLMGGDDDPRHSDDICKAGKMKMLKSSMDENVWQKFYFVMVDKMIYYYASRKSKEKTNYDDDDDEEDDEDANEMPWKGCFNVTVATVGAAPTAISSKAKVFQIKTPLRTFILKARHEVDAEEWMAHICAAQQGVPVEQRESKLRKYDVYNDPLADKLEAGSDVSLDDILKHPVGLRYLMQHLSAELPDLAKAAKVFKAIEKYKKKVVPEKKMKKALKIFKKFVRGSQFIPKATQAEIADQVEKFDFAAKNLFGEVERILRAELEKHLPSFKEGATYQTLLKSIGPKMITVSRDKQSDRSYKLDGCVIVGRSHDNDMGDGYIRLEDDKKVSREHCKIDTGLLTVLVTDMGSSKGTRLDSKDGDKVMAKVILPGQSLYIGGYVLTYSLGQAPAATGKKKGGGIMSGLFGGKKK